MWHRQTAVSILVFAFALPNLAPADDDSPRRIVVNCDRGDSLERAVERARPGTTLLVKGTCEEAVVIETDDLALVGRSGATVDAGGAGIPITVNGARRVSISDLTLANGIDGLLVTANAAVKLSGLTVRDNERHGILVTDSANAELSHITISQNGVDGMRVRENANTVITGSFTSTFAGAFGMNVLDNGSARVERANIRLNQNAVGLQVGVNSSIFVDDEDAVLDASYNLVLGLTVVSNSEVFVIKGKLTAGNNGLRGASIFSGSLLELDNGASLDVSDNQLDGIRLDGSALNLFNMPQEAGSTLLANGNGRFGISAGKASAVDVTGTGSITANDNGAFGMLIDDGSRALLNNSMLTRNTRADLSINFGSRAEVNDTIVGTLQCDATVLVRGNQGLACPAP